jgi:antitoxin component YwqK of YwqJK toxin-antitoxin module
MWTGYFLSFGLACLHFIPCGAQHELALLVPDEHILHSERELDRGADLDQYERFNHFTGGDSLRYCGGRPCTGWAEDLYGTGALKHRGLYDEGRLMVYRNHFPNGSVEREFKQQDAIKSTLRTFYEDGTLNSETKYADGSVVSHRDHYPNGAVRYVQERHRKEPYYLRMDLFASTGEPISLLRLVDRRNVEFELQDFHPGGVLQTVGRARYDPRRLDSVRIGTWRYYSADGSLVREEEYVSGKLHLVR